MDRLRLAQDNAEHLYRYVSANHPQVNVWYLIMRDAPDWARLKKSGFKLVAYGSREHILLMLNAVHVISSHINVEQTDPIERKYYPRRPQWRFTFLQHGITKDDLSAWLNGKDPALFITATRPEFESVTADFTPYVFTTKEVALTGFPRHDALLKKRALAEAQPLRRLLLIVPTWRDSLLKKKKNDPTKQRELAVQLHDTEYARSWFGLLRSPELLSAAAERDLEVAFLPHPELQAHISDADMPPGVRLITIATSDVQVLIVSAELMITDYSSLAFEAAFLDIPVVYFQFDRGSVFDGGHTFAKGYFDYQKDGFGPVTDDIDAAVRATRDILANGGMPEGFRHRAANTFTLRDGQACKRTYEAIVAMDDPISPV